MDNLSLAQWAASPGDYEAAFNRGHRRDLRAHSETQQRRVAHHGWEAQEAFRQASPTPGAVTPAAVEAARRKTHG